MITDTALRKVFWIGAVFNACAAAMLALPSTFGAPVGLPPSGSPFHAWLLAWFVAVLGGAFVWLARAPVISRPLVALAAFGKIGAFVVGAACFAAGTLSARTFAVTIADLAFGVVFIVWLRRTA